MPVQRMCKLCGRSIIVWSTLQNKCKDCTLRTAKKIPIKGKRAKEYETWRDVMAIPYLDKRYGHVCSVKGCSETENLDVHHIKGRGSHPHLKYDVKNVAYVCRPHHRQITDGKEPNNA